MNDNEVGTNRLREIVTATVLQMSRSRRSQCLKELYSAASAPACFTAPEPWEIMPARLSTFKAGTYMAKKTEKEDIQPINATIEGDGVLIVGNHAPVTITKGGEKTRGKTISADQLVELDTLVSEIAEAREVEPLAVKKELAEALELPDFSFITDEVFQDAWNLLGAWKGRIIREAVNRNGDGG